MILLSSILVGLLFAAGLFLVMRRNMFEILLGILLLSHGTNLFLISMSGWHPEAKPPILQEQVEQHVGSELDDSRAIELRGTRKNVDPLPQALILTAIVIGFSVAAFLMVLLARGWHETRTLEIGELAEDVAQPPEREEDVL